MSAGLSVRKTLVGKLEVGGLLFDVGILKIEKSLLNNN